MSRSSRRMLRGLLVILVMSRVCSRPFLQLRDEVNTVFRPPITQYTKFELEKDSQTRITVLNQGHMYGIYSRRGMDYGVWEGMGYEGTLCGNQPGNTKNLWV